MLTVAAQMARPMEGPTPSKLSASLLQVDRRGGGTTGERKRTESIPDIITTASAKISDPNRSEKIVPTTTKPSRWANTRTSNVPHVDESHEIGFAANRDDRRVPLDGQPQSRAGNSTAGLGQHAERHREPPGRRNVKQ
jgi:hypothetical protein